MLASISVPLVISGRYSTPDYRGRAGDWLRGRVFSILRASSRRRIRGASRGHRSHRAVIEAAQQREATS